MKNIVNEYEMILSSIDRIIDISPYKTSYIIEKLGVSPANYHRKKKDKSFTLKEMKKLAEIFDTNEMEDKLLLAYTEKIESEERNMKTA